MEDFTVFSLVTDKSYFNKAIVTINDLRNVGNLYTKFTNRIF